MTVRRCPTALCLHETAKLFQHLASIIAVLPAEDALHDLRSGTVSRRREADAEHRRLLLSLVIDTFRSHVDHRDLPPARRLGGEAEEQSRLADLFASKHGQSDGGARAPSVEQARRIFQKEAGLPRRVPCPLSEPAFRDRRAAHENQPARRIFFRSSIARLNIAFATDRVALSHRVWTITRIKRSMRSQGCCQAVGALAMPCGR